MLELYSNGAMVIKILFQDVASNLKLLLDSSLFPNLILLSLTGKNCINFLL